MGITTGIVLVASRSGEIADIGAAPSPKERKATQAILQAERFKPRILSHAEKTGFVIPSIALSNFDSFLAQAKSVQEGSNFDHVLSLAQQAKDSIDYPGADKTIKTAENFKNQIEKRAKSQKFTIPRFAFDTHATLLTEAKSVFGEGDYLRAKQSANDAKLALDYPKAQSALKNSEKAIEYTKRSSSSDTLIKEAEQLLSQARTAFTKGDYLEVLAFSQQILDLLKEDVAVEAPTITPNGGTFTDQVTVTLETDTPNADIHYTTDGSAPTPNSSRYTGPFTLTETMTVKAIAVLGTRQSAVVNAMFIIEVPQGDQVSTPVISPEADVFKGSMTVTITSDTPDTEIYYTTDGRSINKATATRYIGPFAISRSAVIRAQAFRAGYLDSKPTSKAYFADLFHKNRKQFGDYKTAVLLGRFEDSSPEPMSKSVIMKDIFIGDDSLNIMFRTMSMNQLSLVGSEQDIYGWFTIPMKKADLHKNCSRYGEVGGLIATAAQEAGVDLSRYGRVIQFADAIDCDGPTTHGGPSDTDPTFFGNVYPSYVHEYAHRIGSGLGHAVIYRCGSKQIDVYLSCQPEGDYSDIFDFMGRGANLNAGYKDAAGYLPSDRIQTITTNGIYIVYTTTSNLEMPATGAMALKIPVPAGTIAQSSPGAYYLEYRTVVGSDGIPEGMSRGISIHAGIAGGSEGAYFLDMTPETSSVNDAALGDGMAFIDTVNNIRATQISHTANSVTIKVEFGAITGCIRANPSMPDVYRSQQARAGQSVQYPIRLTNGDSKDCPPTTFVLSTEAPTPLSAVPHPTTVTIEAGKNQMVNFIVSSPPDAPIGPSSNYIVKFKASDESNPSRSTVVQGIYRIVLRDTTPPTVNIDVPQDKARVYGTISPLQITFKDDAGIQKIEYFVGDTLVDQWRLGYDLAIPRSWNTTKVSNGNYVFRARVTDYGQNTAENTVPITVENPSPPKADVTATIDYEPNDVFSSAPTIRGYVTVTNKGTARATNVRVRFFKNKVNPKFSDTSDIADQFVTLEAGTSQKLTFSFKRPKNGSYTMSTVIDDGDPGSIPEINDALNDNSASVPYDITPI